MQQISKNCWEELEESSRNIAVGRVRGSWVRRGHLCSGCLNSGILKSRSSQLPADPGMPKSIISPYDGPQGTICEKQKAQASLQN